MRTSRQSLLLVMLAVATRPSLSLANARPTYCHCPRKFSRRFGPSAAVIAAFGGNAVGGACLLAPKPKRPRYNKSACLATIGVTNAWADSALFNHTYEQLAAECHGLVAFDAVFIRPPPKSATTHGSTPESVFIKPLPDRLVSVIDDRLDHFNEAIKKAPKQLRAAH